MTDKEEHLYNIDESTDKLKWQGRAKIACCIFFGWLFIKAWAHTNKILMEINTNLVKIQQELDKGHGSVLDADIVDWEKAYDTVQRAKPVPVLRSDRTK